MRDRKAIYAGSFDPVTYGHLDIIKRGTDLFDQVIIGMGTNPAKRYLFSLKERQEMMTTAVSLHDIFITKVKIEPVSGLLIDFAKEKGARALIRGLRAVTDFENEFAMGLTNMDMSPNIETVFLLTKPVYQFISSSMVKEIAMFDGDVSKYVPPVVNEALKEKFGSKNKK